MKKHHILLVVLAVLVGSCRKEQSEESDLGYGYFPRQVGAWVEYQVDSSWRDDPVANVGAVSYRLKEKVVEQYTDPAGRTAWRIHRFVLNADSEWEIRDVWTSTMDQVGAEVTEENKRRQKLSFPVRNGRRWDVNVYNTDEELEVAFREVGRAWSGVGLSYAKTSIVRQVIPANPVITNNYEERWAEGVGMVQTYREYKNQQSTGCLGCWRLDMVAIAYGTE
ncbi:MAG: hypothetical protein IPJ85_11410 [Flavobacteriales bacterium]|nr:hypothetical protein [Flavobacteriales bacterium]